MELNRAMIEKIAQGVIFFEDGPCGGLIPRRFSKKQIETYDGNERFAIRAKASSGCCLAWETDACEMVLKFRCFTGSARDFYGFDLMVNDLLYAHLEDSVSEKPEGEWRVSLPEGTKSLKLHLPNLAGVEIISLSLPGASVIEPIGHSRRILFMGDSITMGYTAHFPSGTYPARVAAALNAEYLNQAIGGERFHPEILDENLDWNPDMIVLAYGTNDWSGKSKEQFISDCAEFTRRITGIWPDVPTYMLTPIWRLDYLTRRDDFSFEEAACAMEEIAEKYPNIQMIRGENLVPWSAELMADGYLHPNDLGFVHYAERLLARLKAF